MYISSTALAQFVIFVEAVFFGPRSETETMMSSLDMYAGGDFLRMASL